MDLWDSFTPKDLLDSKPGTNPYAPDCHRVRLYGNKNIGQVARTNMVVGGQLSCDQTGVILNWYARTNMVEVYEPVKTSEFSRAWTAWVHASVATLIIGCSPRHSVPLANLFGPRTFGNLCGVSERERSDEADIRKMAAKMYDQHEHPKDALEACAERVRRDLDVAFRDLTKKQQEIWLSAARVHPLRRPVIVPVRQNFAVAIDSDIKATQVLLKVMPENVAPMPLVWVHLAGVLSRDVA